MVPVGAKPAPTGTDPFSPSPHRHQPIGTGTELLGPAPTGSDLLGPAPNFGTGTELWHRHRTLAPAPTFFDRHRTGKRSVPVKKDRCRYGAGQNSSVPVRAGQKRSVSMPVRCRSQKVGADTVPVKKGRCRSVPFSRRDRRNCCT